MQRRPRAELRRPGPIPCCRRSRVLRRAGPIPCCRRSRVWHPRLTGMGGRLGLWSLWRTRRSYHRELPNDCRRTLQACSTDESILYARCRPHLVPPVTDRISPVTNLLNTMKDMTASATSTGPQALASRVPAATCSSFAL
eukprot:COSAG03_NODE_97_length_13082_cov_27.816529_12_plen_140_part_00